MDFVGRGDKADTLAKEPWHLFRHPAIFAYHFCWVLRFFSWYRRREKHTAVLVREINSGRFIYGTLSGAYINRLTCTEHVGR